MVGVGVIVGIAIMVGVPVGEGVVVGVGPLKTLFWTRAVPLRALLFASSPFRVTPLLLAQFDARFPETAGS